MFSFVQIRIGDEQNQVGPLGRLACHFAARSAADFVDAGRIDEHDLRRAEARNAVPRSVPGDVPDLFRPAAPHIDGRDRFADQGIDEGRFCRC